jgi:hypothetical protein
VKIGIRDLVSVEVLDGLSEGSVVALDEEELLSEGKRVSATMKAASP